VASLPGLRQIGHGSRFGALGPQKRSDEHDFASKEQSAEDGLIVSSQPKRQVDVKLSARSAVYRAAKLVIGQRPPLNARTAHSTRTRVVRAALHRKRRIMVVIGNARMLPAMTAQTAVCRILIAVSIEGRTERSISTA
jgi:hypothetical protein